MTAQRQARQPCACRITEMSQMQKHWFTLIFGPLRIEHRHGGDLTIQQQ